MNRRNLSRLLLLVVMVAAITAAFTFRQDLNPAALQSGVDDFGALAPLVFIALFAAATVLFLPGSVFALAGGALFGPLLGTAFNLSGATIGAIIAFFAARYLASDWVAERTGGKLRLLIDGVETEGWRFVAFTRLVPLFPFNLLNYALGLTRINPLAYGLATVIAMIPGAIAYTYLGYAGREAIAGSEGAIQKGLLALGLLAAALFLPRLIKRLRKGVAI
ncbi:MAG: TVP38/TMEM64 family protein [Alphaproteobacteria bacterium]|nr:TVP38/TMEM64 family protein [Alphaproteobacteria bacterium]